MIKRFVFGFVLWTLFIANSYAGCRRVADITELKISFLGKSAERNMLSLRITDTNINDSISICSANAGCVSIVTNNCNVGTLHIVENSLADFKIGDLIIPKESRGVYIYIIREKSGKIIAKREDTMTKEEWTNIGNLIGIPLDETLSIDAEMKGRKFVITFKYRDRSSEIHGIGKYGIIMGGLKDGSFPEKK